MTDSQDMLEEQQAGQEVLKPPLRRDRELREQKPV